MFPFSNLFFFIPQIDIIYSEYGFSFPIFSYVFPIFLPLQLYAFFLSLENK